MVCALSRRLSDTPVHPRWAKVPVLGIESCPYMSLHLLYLRWGICALLPIKRFGSWIDPPKSVSSAHAISSLSLQLSPLFPPGAVLRGFQGN